MRLLLLWVLLLSWCSKSYGAAIQSGDIAIVLPPTGGFKIPADEPYFSPKWLDRVDELFRQTSVEDAFLKESARSSWRLVSMRIAPCQPLLPFLSELNQTLCEAEIRLVWQPIQEIRERGLRSHYADDRAIHALYHVDGGSVLSPDEAEGYASLKSRSLTLSETERSTYSALHKKVVQSLTVDLLNLRGLSRDGAYLSIEERPEFGTFRSAKTFIQRLEIFLQKRARFERLKELTAFSLPEGRQPPLLDDWVFVDFYPAMGGLDLAPRNILLQSRKDGRTLFDYGPFMNATMRFDDERLHRVLDTLPANDVSEIREAVLLAPRSPAPKKDAIANRLTTHVGHTSCASCHKLKSPPFDFHNFSYFEDRPLVPSPRVEEDVALDLEWLRANIAPGRHLTDPL